MPIEFDNDFVKTSGKKRFSFRRSIFPRSDKQLLEKSKFLFDSSSLISSSNRSSIIKTSTINTSNTSINYDESDNDYSSSDSEEKRIEKEESKDYYSLEELGHDNTSKRATPKPTTATTVVPLSESTLCYSSNTNTINTMSIEFGKNKVNDEINYGFDENKEIINFGKHDRHESGDSSIVIERRERRESGDSSNAGSSIIIGRRERRGSTGSSIMNGRRERRESAGSSVMMGFGNIENNIILECESSESEENIKCYNIDDIENIDIYSDDGDDEYEENEENEKNEKTNKKVKKTVKFSDEIEIIEPREYKKSINIFRRAISKIIKKREEV